MALKLTDFVSQTTKNYAITLSLKILRAQNLQNLKSPFCLNACWVFGIGFSIYLWYTELKSTKRTQNSFANKIQIYDLICNNVWNTVFWRIIWHALKLIYYNTFLVFLYLLQPNNRFYFLCTIVKELWTGFMVKRRKLVIFSWCKG